VLPEPLPSETFSLSFSVYSQPIGREPPVELLTLLDDPLEVEDEDLLLDNELLDVRLDEEAEDIDDAEEELVLLELLEALLEDDAEDTDDDLLLDDKLLALLDVLLDDAADDIEDEFDDMLLDDELLELITMLLLLDIDEALETLEALLNDMLDDTDEVTEELLPLPAALDELLATEPPVHAVPRSAIATTNKHLVLNLHAAVFITAF